MTDNKNLENILLDMLININIETYDFNTSKHVFKSSFGSYGETSYLMLYLQPKVEELSFSFLYHTIRDRLQFRIANYNNLDSADDFNHLYHEIQIPRSEEEYFQYNTIQDNIFTLEFFKVLEMTMNELLLKWKMK